MIMMMKKKADVIQIYIQEKRIVGAEENGLVSSDDLYCNSIHCDVMVLYFNSIQIPDTFADTTVHIRAV